MRRILPVVLFLAGACAVGVTMFGAAPAAAEQARLTYRVVAPQLADGDTPEPVAPTTMPEPTTTPEPQPYAGAVQALYLESARLTTNAVVETRGVDVRNGREVLQDPTGPFRIAWYPDFGHPGFRANNSLFAAHIDYVGIGKVVFGYLTSAQPGDALYVTMDDGTQYAYTVNSVDVIHLADLDMNAVVYPSLDSYTERITLISCGGTFVPYASGGGEYDSRVILVAERYIP